MRTLTALEATSTGGGSLSGVFATIAGACALGAEAAAEAGVASQIVPGVGTAVGGCLLVGAGVMAIAAGVAELAS